MLYQHVAGAWSTVLEYVLALERLLGLGDFTERSVAGYIPTDEGRTSSLRCWSLPLASTGLPLCPSDSRSDRALPPTRTNLNGLAGRIRGGEIWSNAVPFVSQLEWAVGAVPGGNGEPISLEKSRVKQTNMNRYVLVP
ncbi:hypothetical protein CONPUDRAFT_72088 [Coniophora puteana RWD-64-598 SS2]|uniref:Uncharacterized protein n=1 Tax=Coniophora puteana (strain RWD-64-598) TaxID=741705 RepID=A0A5M3MSM8_CONPW|nr:uncharacterized protein CONPUDRAFT_72088 [Coniophora puteana RWD-64-598 SS2]EIW81665.1 hypothetical protein CONPUDRAFT_72088 [Coniophora puteana RWD-64-598 SS2]